MADGFREWLVSSRRSAKATKRPLGEDAAWCPVRIWKCGRVSRTGKSTELRFLVQYKPLIDGDGRVVRWYATGTDINDRKRAEEQVHNENLALREEVSRASMFEKSWGRRTRSATYYSRSRRWRRQTPPS